ncbi:MAG: SPOR domain-containing protein [Bacteroidales bacterium]|nr:SPOR domain-containing protein [Bacteroidales bacterium]
MKKVLIFQSYFFLSFFLYPLSAQTSDVFNKIQNKESRVAGEVKIVQETNIRDLVLKHLATEQNSKGIPGYRIAILFATGEEAMDKIFKTRSDLKSRYPELIVHTLHDNVYYRIYLGDFRTYSEALKYLKKVENIYSGAYIVESTIDFPPLN